MSEITDAIDMEKAVDALLDEPELHCRHCGGETFAAWYPVSERQGIDLLGVHEGVVRYEYDGDTTTGECGPDDEYACLDCGATSPNLEYLVGLADQEEPRIEQDDRRDEVEAYGNLADNETEDEAEYHRLRAAAASKADEGWNDAFDELSDREKVKRYAGLIFNVGTIIEDRRDGSYVGAAQADDPLWAYLWENVNSLYEQIGPVIDRVEIEVFGEEDV